MTAPLAAKQVARPRVLYLDHTARMGGGEIALLNLLAVIDRTREEPIVALFSDGPLREKLGEIGIETYVVPLPIEITETRKDSLSIGALMRGRELFRVSQFCQLLAEWLREHRIDLVHANSLKSDILGGIAARIAGRKIIWHVRDRIANDYLPTPAVRIFRILCRVLPTIIVVNSAATKQTLGGAKAIVVHDGTILLPTETEMTARDAANQFPVVGLIGRITKWKGQDVFIRAADIVRESFPDAKFKIIGAAMFSEQSFDREIRELTVTLGLSNVIEFSGFREDISAALHELDLVVHASTIGEPFGQVVIEAMAAGKAVIATRGGGIPEIVDSDSGWLVPMGDPIAMAHAICKLLADEKLRNTMGRAGRRRVAERFLIQHVAENISRVHEMCFRE